MDKPDITTLKATAIAQLPYGTHTIYIKPDGTFCAPYDGGIIGSETLKLIQENLDRRDAARARMAKAKLAVPVISTRGIRGVLTGFHSGNGRCLTKPAIEVRYGNSLYLDRPRVGELLAEIARLDKAHSTAKSELFEYEIKHADCGYRQDPQIDAALANVQELEKRFPQ